MAEWRNFNKTFGNVFKLSLGYFFPCEMFVLESAIA